MGGWFKLICNVCKDFADTLKLKSRYKSKVIEDVVKYGKHGTTYILKPNLKRHMQSEGHKVCLEMKTGMPRSKKNPKFLNFNLLSFCEKICQVLSSQKRFSQKFLGESRSKILRESRII